MPCGHRLVPCGRRWVPQLCRPVAVARGRGTTGCRSEAVELQVVPQKKGQSGTWLWLVGLINPAGEGMGKSFRGKVGGEGKIYRVCQKFLPMAAV
jgi:hypothetical protein